MIDLHCHILPGLDDGVQTLEEALEMARTAEKEGVEKIVGTPHVFRGNFVYENLGAIEEKRLELSRALKDANIRVGVFAGAEVNISHNLIQKIRDSRQNLVLNGSSYMFAEFPADHVYSGVKNLFFELMSEGITPIIAHPERNSVFVQNPELLYELIQMGALAQANSGSFLGLHGSSAEKAVFQFLEWKLIHFIASDGHHARGAANGFQEAIKRAETIVGKDKAQAFVKDNPQAVLDDKEIPYLDSPINPKERKKSFHIKIPNFFGKK